jgi:very-short-patch-repair endonuclease/predicted transcriptional regulator of viral defense system
VHTLSVLQAIARDNGGLITRQQALRAGVAARKLTANARRGVIARVARGVYAVPSRASEIGDPLVITAAWNVVLSFESAAAWWGVNLPRPAGLLHVTAPRSRGRWRDAVRGVRLHRATLRAGDVVTLRGLRVTSPLRTALDIARHASLEDAVAIVDSFLRAGLFTQEEFNRVAVRAAGPGRVRLQQVAMLADPESGSILESLTRVLLWRHQLAPEISQYPFRHPRTGWVGRVDFAWLTRQVILECDGYEFHSGPSSFRQDRRRWSAINRAGWRCAVVTWFDVTGDPGYVASLVRDLLAEPVAA